tara:strand:- start:1186 stop:3768 length:2583 start_codon:yes stop_codon:yes gene_type:complete
MTDYSDEEELHEVISVTGMYENWFMDYASYVILERAVPAIEDGLKPVQRRIFHAMKELDDGRYNKVANIIGTTMQFHPHGDASIADAIVNLGQKELLIDMQGNWGDVRTGDGAAAPRYIEARLSKFALDVLFNPQTTSWQLSYDGRKKEPVTFPVKFPLLLSQGVEGIAVGLSTKMMPHNFVELINACIDLLKGRSVKLYPDFQTGGKIDITDYNDGRRGGKVRVRSVIEEFDSKTLIIKEIPYATTTSSLIESIIKASEKGKIKIKQVIDNTAADIEIQIQLPPGISPGITIDALYAFTDCELSISPNACVIIDDKPHFVGISEILKYSVDQTKDLLRQELEIRKNELLEKILFSSLEKIFIENRIYRDIEECETWEAVLQAIGDGLEPFTSSFYRLIVQEDLVRLTEIKIKRISKFDAFKTDELMKRLNEELTQTLHDLENLTAYAIDYYQNLLDKYGKGRERKTEIANFDTIQATRVAANNAKLYVNRVDGFIGTGLKKDEFVSECSDIDDVIIFREDGVCVVSRIQDKVFVGKNVIHVGVYKKGDERMVYNMIYKDGNTGRSMIKRFNVLGITRDKEYPLTKESKGSKVLYFSANPNGEAELVTVHLTAASSARKKIFDVDFVECEIKGRSASGNIVTKFPVRKIQLKTAGNSTLGGLDIWYDQVVGRLNTDHRGALLGNFKAEDLILVFYHNGTYELTSFELTNRYDTKNILQLTKFVADKPITSIYQDGNSKLYFIKRFLVETVKTGKPYLFISENKNSLLFFVSCLKRIEASITYKEKNKKEIKTFELTELIDVKGWKAVGNKFPVQQLVNLEVLPNSQEDIAPTTEINELDALKKFIQKEVEREDNQMGLFD